jgi:hypothetical protein
MTGMFCSKQARFKGSTYVWPGNATYFDVLTISVSVVGDLRAAAQDITSKVTGVDGLISAFVR